MMPLAHKLSARERPGHLTYVENLIAIAWVNSHSCTPKIRSAPPRGGGEQGGSAPPRQDRPGGEQKSAMGGSTWEGKSKPYTML